MIDTKAVLSKAEQWIGEYENELKRYDMEKLTRKPSEDEWSMGEMYMHLIRTTLYMHLANVEACGTERGIVGGEKTEQGIYMFEIGGFPPVAIKVPPSPQYTPPQPENVEALLEGLEQVRQRMRELEPKLAAIPADRTIAHPRLGFFNAVEWFALIEMHFRHHFRQKEKLDAFLQSEAAAG